MEAPLLSGFLNTILAKLLCLAEEKYKVYSGVKDDLEFLGKELHTISGFIDVQLSSQKANLSTEQSIYKFAEELKRLRNMPAEDQARCGRYTNTTTSSTTQLAGCSSCLCSDLPALAAAEDDPVGIDAPRDELVKQLAEEDRGQQKQLKVVAIVGLAGSGKTVLARAVYDSKTGEGFDLRAWVHAGERGPEDVLMEIFRHLVGTTWLAPDADKIKADLRERLADKRCLIVIDDMRTGQWSTIESALPSNGRFCVRILVSTTVQSVADNCCSTNGYAHTMRRLDNNQSKALFFKKACLNSECLGYADQDFKQIFDKCDGQAIALVTVAQYLRKTGWPTKHTFDNACQKLRCELLEDETMEGIRRVLVRTYASLPCHATRACILYFGMFPCDRPVRRKNLMRLWLAEGFLEAKPLYGSMDLADKNFDKLVDFNIILPTNMSNNNKVKTCRT